jgi:hypothetical protein
MRQKIRGLPLDLLIEGMLHKPVDRDSYRLLHGCTGYGAYLAFADSPFRFSPHLFPNSRFEIRD